MRQIESEKNNNHSILSKPHQTDLSVNDRQILSGETRTDVDICPYYSCMIQRMHLLMKISQIIQY